MFLIGFYEGSVGLFGACTVFYRVFSNVSTLLNGFLHVLNGF